MLGLGGGGGVLLIGGGIGFLFGGWILLIKE